MASVNDFPHLYIPVEHFKVRQSYTPPKGGGGGKKKRWPSPSIGRAKHGSNIKTSIENAKAQRSPSMGIEGSIAGTYLEFESFPDAKLSLESLGNRQGKDVTKHIVVTAVSEQKVVVGSDSDDNEKHEATVQKACVFVPDSRMERLLTKIDEYANDSAEQAKHTKAYDGVASVRGAVLMTLWTDPFDDFPTSDTTSIWWEIWLRRTDGKEYYRFETFAANLNIQVSPQRLPFPEHIVVVAKATIQQLTMVLAEIGDVSELRKAKELAYFYRNQPYTEQVEWTDDLRERIVPPKNDAPVVCVLDTGVNDSHPLLRIGLSAEDCYTIRRSWGTGDDSEKPHGTRVAGLSLYGSLSELLIGEDVVQLEHGLESVKVFSPSREEESGAKLFGAVTAQAISYPEISSPDRKRIFSLTITNDGKFNHKKGEPTSWSSSIDALALGRIVEDEDEGLTYLDDGPDRPRLFVISAGNVEKGDLVSNHLDNSDARLVQDPAQAWNVLTVGAFTNLDEVDDPDLGDFRPLAERGELSPWSTTSVAFDRKLWPIKPDIVMEGGNVLYDGAGSFDGCDDLSVLTTDSKHRIRMFDTINATSAAAPQAARLCAIVAANYPKMSFEMIRALIVHSARWTPAMHRHFDGTKNSKGKIQSLIRRYGYGVPSLRRMLYSQSNAATLLIDDTIKPFCEKKLNEIHFHDLPWPKDVLVAMEPDANVTLRVTLSYFIEPNPGRKTWAKRQQYASFGLRFGLKMPTESNDEFRKRLNQQALLDGEKKPSGKGESKRWLLGADGRVTGSLHCDILQQHTAAELAECGSIAIFPVGGWWKTQPSKDRSANGVRYALIISIETDETNVDLYTPLKVAIDSAVQSEIDIVSG